MTRFKAALLLTLLIAAPHTASAVVIEFTESAKTVTAGIPFTLQLRISDVSVQLDPPLKSFDVEIGFSQSDMHFEGAVFGDPNIGDQLNSSGLADQSVSGASPIGPFLSSVRIAEASNDLSTPLQPGEFVLATLSFRALASGTSDIAVLVAILDGFDGGFPVVFMGASTITAVPEPDSLLWMFAALGLAAVRGFAARRRTR